MEPADLSMEQLPEVAYRDGGDLDEIRHSSAPSRVVTARADARLRDIVDTHFDFIWRSLRRLGVPADAVDDAAQRVFWVAAQNLRDIRAESERAYLFSTALRVASDVRRVRARVREVQADAMIAQAEHPSPDPEQLLDQKRAREILDALLDELPMELRTVIVLVEGDGLTATEVAGVLDIPEGTVNSRLRRGRESLSRSVERLKKRAAKERGARQ
jgi:RNA polymerase sigma-70 factor (ECF subfamily)